MCLACIYKYKCMSIIDMNLCFIFLPLRYIDKILIRYRLRVGGRKHSLLYEANKYCTTYVPPNTPQTHIYPPLFTVVYIILTTMYR